MIVALHGFLGTPSDWGATAAAFSNVREFVARDLWADLASDEVNGFETWVSYFISSLPQDKKPLLVGYSMGGRLAMQALVQAPERFAGAVLISANPGLKSKAERDARLEGDLRWAERFKADPWPDLMRDWNAQPVLRQADGSAPPVRPESDFSRPLLAAAMDRWSLARQRDLSEDLPRLDLPLLYLTGALDVKFSSLAVALEKKSGKHRHRAIPDAGHRVPWDNPTAFLTSLKNFASDVP